MSENGFNDLSKQLNKMAKNAKNLEKKKQISFYELFTEKFMTKNTSFKSVEAIPENEMDKFVVSNSKFSSWNDMLGSATEEYFVKQLRF